MYFSQIMRTSQHPISLKTERPVPAVYRWISAGIFTYIVGEFVFLWLCAREYIQPEFILGVCGFKQRYQLPCPGCGITHSAMEFVTGHIFRSFYTQPAGAIICIFAFVVGVFAFIVAVFGRDFGLIQRFNWRVVLRYLVISAIVIFGGGWAVTLARTLAEKGT